MNKILRNNEQNSRDNWHVSSAVMICYAFYMRVCIVKEHGTHDT